MHFVSIYINYVEIEVANPIGPKSGFHKLGKFYVTIQNLPPHFHSILENIFTVLICHSLDIKRYGFKKILDPLIKELQKFESDEGVTFILKNDETLTIHGILICFIGDTLAAHEIFELLSPSCNFFCRQCMITRQLLRDGTRYTSLKRNKMLHEDHLRKIESGEITPADCGVRGNSVLNHLKYFHSTENIVFDIMHDLLEGVVGISIKWCLMIISLKPVNLQLTN